MTTTDANTQTSRPNFFILLGLDPNAPWNPKLFTDTLHKKQTEWSRQGSGVARQALTAKKNLSFIPRIREVMDDENLRQEEAAAARIQLATNRKARLEELTKQVAFINAKSTVEQAELDKFVSEFEDTLSPGQIKALIKVKPREPGSNTASADLLLDPTITKNIADHLQIVNKQSLYQVLSLSDATATPVLYQTAQELYTDNVHREPKTAEVTALLSLAGFASDVFKSDETRKKYDESLRRASLDTLLKDLDATMSRSNDKLVQSGQVTLFLENAQKAGWEQQKALERLNEHIQQRKWSMLGTIEESLRCRKCNKLNPKSQKRCTGCGRELSVDCPNCGQPVISEANSCGNCGFPVGSRYYVEDQLEEVARLLQINNYNKAREVLDKVEVAWKPKKQDEFLRKIQEYKSVVKSHEDAKEQERQEVTQKLETLTREKHYVAAKQLLQLKGAIFSDRVTRQKAIEETITLTQNIINRALKPDVPQNDKMADYEQAKELCADHPDLASLQKTLVLFPPGNLQARAREGVVSLEWRPSSTKASSILYSIMRKSRAQPNSLQDQEGQIIGTVPGFTYEDTRPEAGVPLYYAVYAQYDQLVSNQPARLSQPILLTQDVLALAASVDDQQVALSWEPPTHAHSIIILRNDQVMPTSVQDGVRVAECPPDRKSLIDRHVQNGQVYYYALFCQFKDHEGRFVLSQGQVISATPDLPPRPIDHITIKSTQTDHGHDVVINWNRPQRGNAAIIKSAKPLTLSAGKDILESQLLNLGQKLEHLPDSVKDVWTKAGVAYYTSVVIFQGRAYIGASERFACLNNVTNLKHQNTGSAIRFHWKWPENCQEVFISYSVQGWPEHNDPGAMTRRVNIAQYENLGHYDLTGTLNQNYYIVVSALINQDGAKIPAEGIRIYTRIGPKLTFTYEIRNRRKRTLRLYITDRAGGTIPALLLVSKQGGLPFKKMDGDIIQRIDPLLIAPGEKEKDIPLLERSFPSRSYGKLFLEDDTMNESVKINHPGVEKLSLS